MSAIAGQPIPVPAGRRPTLTGSVGGELLKLGRLRPVRAGIVFALVVAVPALATVIARTSDIRASAGRGAATFDGALYVLEGLFLTGALPFLLALSGTVVAMEYGHGTIRLLLARGAGRTRLFLAKLLALGVVALGLLSVYSALAAAEYTLAMIVWRVSPAVILTAPWADLALALVTTGVAMAAAVVVGATAGVLGRSVAASLIIGVCFFLVDSLLLPLLTRGVSVGVSLGGQVVMLVIKLRLPALAHGGQDAVQPAAVVAVWLVALLLLSRHLLRQRDVLE
jgi:ABC-2 type transport system permease protein